MHFRLLALVCLCSSFSTLAAPDSIDAFAASPRRIELRAQVEPGQVSSIEPRLGVPNFFWAPREATPKHSLRAEGLNARHAALRYLFTWAPLYGLTGAELVESAALVRLHDTGSGAIVASYEQRVRGVAVFRDRLTVIMNQDLELIALSGHFTSNSAREVFKLGDVTAFQVALADLTSLGVDPSQVRTAGTDAAGMQRFAVDPSASVHLGDVARAKQVLFNLADALVPAWYVELEAGRSDTTDSNLTAYVVSAVDGRLLYRRDLSEADSFTYRVWADGAPAYFPWDGPLGTEVTPHPTGTANNFNPPFVTTALRTLQNVPFTRNDPWLPAGATELTGNNVEAYADLVAPDGFNTGDLRATSSSASTFDYTYDPAVAAGASSTQRMAGLTQLFFNINFLHDWFYDHGFDEAAGNAQTDNLMRGGAGADSIKGEAQDVGGVNNANMSTPADGARPRMQMYLWRTSPPASVVAGAPVSATWVAGNAAFGAQSFTLTGDVVLADDGTAPVTDACTALVNNVAGRIVVIDRGTCSFALKAQTAEAAGAIGVLVVNNAAGTTPPGMGATAGITVNIPTLSLTQADGATLKTAMLAGTVNVTLTRGPSLDRDGDLDNTIVSHEWGHYLSNRLISDGAGIGTNQARGMGEGWSDTVAMLMLVRASDSMVASNVNWAGVYGMAGYAIGTAAPSNAYYFGIRRYPYSTDLTKNPLTFKHIQDGIALPTAVPVNPNGAVNSEVHNAGEVWAMMLWECYAALLNAPRFTFTQARDRMQDYLVASLKATPANPTFVEARDAWLAVAAATDVRDYTTLGQAFARRGIGLFAVAPDRASTNNTPVVEDFGSGNELTFVKAELDDENFYCDHDGVLDVGERGRLRLTFRNTGFANLSASTATVTTTTPGVTITPSTINLSSSSVQALALGTAEVTVTGLTAPTRLDLQIAWADPALTTRPTPRTTTAAFRMQTDSVAAASATDDAEASLNAWTYTKNGTLSTRFDWTKRALTPMQNTFFGANPTATADLALVSPALTVHATQPLVMTLSHRWAFEAGGGVNYDGAVIEVTTDNGTTWTDVGAPAGYGGAITGTNSTNPLLSRQAYVGRSAGYPAFVTSTIDLGTAFAGQSVKVRFRIGADQGTADVGWDLDSIAFAGITNTPFPTLVADRAQCINRPPVANAGPDLTIDERISVTLDSSRSTDPDSNTMTARWVQRSGAMVTLTGATFTAPEVTADADLAFDLIMNDGTVDSAPDALIVHVRNVNRAPTVDAGLTVTADERAMATLTAVGADPDGDSLTYAWSQVSGPSVTLTTTNAAQLSFTAPEVTRADVTANQNRAVFEVAANDGALTARSRVTLVINDVNRAPTVMSGANATANERESVTVNVTPADPDGDSTTVAWTQVSGPPAALGGATGASLTIVAPEVTKAQVTAGMNLVVLRATATDGALSGSNTVTITVNDVNRAPTASVVAAATSDERTMVTLTGVGVDPDGDTLTYAWKQVAGPTVTLSAADQTTVSFTAPEVMKDAPFAFEVTVSDGQLSATARADLTVRNLNVAPVARPAGPAEVKSGDTVTLDGTASSDADGDTLRFSWEVDSGPAVTFADATAATTTFTAPTVKEPTELLVRLSVADPKGAVGTATVKMTISPAAAQGCGCATGSGSDAMGVVIALAAWFARRRAVRG